ncbi:transposase-like protein [Bradyrhizobium diazoefficiens]
MLERIDKHRDEDAGLSGILPLRRGDVQPRVRNHGALRLLAVPAEARADGEGARECAHTRAGSYERTLQTKAGDVNLKVPKLRRQTFETAIIERYRRRESSVEEALIEMYLAGISVRRVEDITEALWGTRVSPSTVSNLNKKIYTKIEAWRNRRIEGEHPYLYLDGIVMKRSWAGEVRNVSLLVASAVNAEGFREILGICEGAKEDKSGWSSFLRHLVDRGLRGVQLVVSDACRGLVESVADYLPEARYQRKRRSRPIRKGLAWGLQSVDQRVCKSLAGGMEAATTENYEVRPND